ncbi:Peptidase family M28 [Reichenbachiella agariperforans]|uniref:Peptidase family M28 n=1 Tax=Reichenbachiella agariperforans TaxID=156994 RepID=A0A1M6J9C0_REIAG|nr:M20/M25/M40 family metallo-hydrolase [Reichenbachiella agariperforans]SHJ43287.1 Peptidase family M28 [Reichenbachiella agariperforans]
MKYLLCIIGLILSHNGTTQNLPYAKNIIQTLASEEFKGRGYVDHGDQNAADYIQSQFQSIGLVPFGKSYSQPFTTPVNTFPSAMFLSINGEAKQPGIDFLIDAGSPGIKGAFETVSMEIDDFIHREKLSTILNNSTGKFLIIPDYNPKDYNPEEQKSIREVIDFIKYHPENPASGSISLTTNKLTWSASTAVYAKPSLILKIDSTTSNIHTVKINIKNKFISRYPTQNVVSHIKGQHPDSLVLLTAHYDHLGMMGSETIFPGANDNASGIAMLLSLAKHYKENTPKYTTVFIAFGGEELGLLGSKHFVEHPMFELSQIKFLINFDISGTGDDGIQVVNGSIYPDEFDRLRDINEKEALLHQVKIRGEACNSDHCFFHQQNVPSFFIYTLGGIQAYHDIYDRSETLPMTAFEDYFQLMTVFIDGL